MPTRFAIISTQRSGTTMLMYDLNTHPDVICHSELYSVGNKSPSSYLLYRGWRPWRSPGGHLDRLFDKSETSAVGLKIMYNHLRLPGLKAALSHRKVKLIHVVRDNALKAHVSYLTAKKRRRFAATAPVDVVKVECPVDGLLARLLESQRQVARHRAWCAKEGGIELGYEAMTLDRAGEYRRLLEFLDVEVEVPMDAGTVKLNPDDLSVVLSNYEEVATALADTPFARYL